MRSGRPWIVAALGSGAVRIAAVILVCLAGQLAGQDVDTPLDEVRRVFSRDKNRLWGDYMANYRLITRLGAPGELRPLIDWEGLPEFEALPFSAKADFMLRRGDLVEFVADQHNVSKYAKWHTQSTECWESARRFADNFQFASSPADLPATKALLLNGIRDYASYHWIYCQIQKSRPHRKSFVPLDAYAALGPDHVGTVTLREWRKELISVHGVVGNAVRMGAGSPKAEAWKRFVEATEAYDALAEKFADVLRRRGPDDGAKLPAERNSLNQIYPISQQSSP